MQQIVTFVIAFVTAFGLARMIPARGQAPAAGALVVDSATYGVFDDGKPVAGKTITVTDAVRRLVRDGQLRLEVGNDPFGDPASGEGKTLAVRYTLGGTPGTLVVAEGDTLLIPVPKLAGALAVKKATYGDHAQGMTYDVTDLVKARLRDGRLEVKVDNDVLGDPAVGTFKQLRVEYTIGDVELVKRTYEGGTLTITEPGKQPAAK